MAMSEWAHEVARERLAVKLPRRWAHVQGVAVRAAEAAPLFGDDGDMLVTAAVLHDVGYAPDIAQTGFHPLDGARYLESLNATDRLCALVARHSGAIEEARFRGLESTLGKYPDECTPLRDALWWADMTTTPDGKLTTVDERLNEISRRYGVEHLIYRSIERSAPELRAAVERTCQRMRRNSLAI